MRSLLHLTGTLVSASMLMACAASPPRSEPPPIPASLRQPCRVPPPPADGSRATARRWAEDIALALRECADRHLELARAAAPNP